MLKPGSYLGPKKQYLVVRDLGSGGHGVVLEGYDNVHKRRVAIKGPRADSQNPEVEARLKREYDLLEKIKHDNIVKVYEFIQKGGVPYIIMEYVECKKLREGPSTIEKENAGRKRKDALRIGRQIALALAKAHANGVIHRDLTYNNV